MPKKETRSERYAREYLAGIGVPSDQEIEAISFLQVVDTVATYPRDEVEKGELIGENALTVMLPDGTLAFVTGVGVAVGAHSGTRYLCLTTAVPVFPGRSGKTAH